MNGSQKRFRCALFVLAVLGVAFPAHGADSLITVGAGASITAGSGADVCADSRDIDPGGAFYGDWCKGTCPDCSGDPCEIWDVIFEAGRAYDCIYTYPVIIGPGVTVEADSDVAIRAPKTDFRPGFRATEGAVVRILPSN